MKFLPLKKLLCLLICIVLESPGVHAQNKATLGIYSDAALKVYPIKYYTPFSAMQAGLTFRVENEQSNKLGLFLGLGFMLDHAHYKIESESSPSSRMYVTMLQRNLSFTGLVVFPTRNESLKILGGIGIDFNMAINAWHHFRSSGQTTASHVGLGIDSIITQMDQNRRKLLPAASVGLQYQFPEMKQLKLYLLFRQNLLNAYEEDIPLYELSTGKIGQPATNYKPSFLKLGLSYDFW